MIGAASEDIILMYTVLLSAHVRESCTVIGSIIMMGELKFRSLSVKLVLKGAISPY
jgi:hypothetical protein